MPREFTRNDRVADALQRELAQLIRDEMRDPRLGMVNITAVEVSRDLSSAKVFVNLVGAESAQESEAAAELLNGAAGFLRSQIAKRMQLRVTPRLRFIYDLSGKRGQELSALIEYAVNSDKQRHRDPDSSGEE
ncbi:30S ribosome-binding factor RbfA [Porticoccus litoralis]|jgi:ribosome-binding factor A|uniref:Ribosome-binding factor A n=1 Tax=Porticoccus litoralis TaxID=434086 RepID=A0AAW8B5N0_9GAMM|nr:30S ribosome-binding factor RbfA [Porticoccus litoralis]MDP1521399.1 30S ribosome-binding factor RbfA [Porticoccus litoralis]